jgi:DNA (cytosine-5)-methyltransferase 1
MNKLKLLDLFSGIGGFSLGLESTGYFQTIAFVEKDKFCRQVLQKNFNNIPIEEDIRNVRGSNYAADVITGGFPCQPFSVAGKRKGTADDRYLWDETIRVVAECKPRWFIGENVEGLININNGMVLRQVQTDLEEQGFQVQCIVIPASGIGAWHQRKRIWIVAYSDSNRYSNKIRGSSTKEERISQEHRQDHNTTRKSSRASSVWETNNQHVPNTDTGFGIRENQEIQTRGNTITNGSEDVSNSNSWLRGGRGTELQSRDDREWRFYSKEEKQTRDDVRSKVIGCNDIPRKDVPNSNGERPQGYGVQSNNLQKGNKTTINSNNSIEEQQTWWQTQSEFCGVPNGVSYELDKDRSSRIKALGNSIVPQIARQIGLSIMKGELTNNE